MAEDPVTAPTERRESRKRPQQQHACRTHPAVLALARLIGRSMARERFAATTAGNDNETPRPALSEPPGASTGNGITDTS